jgi:hypothetical protein
MNDENQGLEAAEPPVSRASGSLLYARALELLQAVTEECEALNAALAFDEVTREQARVRVQNIHGLAVTPQVEEWS